MAQANQIGYMILSNDKVSYLEQDVNKLLKEGWVVAGGLVLDSNTGRLYQALIRENR